MEWQEQVKKGLGSGNTFTLNEVLAAVEKVMLEKQARENIEHAKNKHLVWEVKRLQQENTNLRLQKMVNFNGDECWVWMNNEPNFPETLMCPIVLMKEDLLRVAENGFNGIENSNSEEPGNE